MPESPEARARKNIDQLLTDAGWIVQSREEVNLAAGRGVAIREFPMKPGFGEADYLLYVDCQAVGVVEAKKEGSTLTGFEIQTAKYSEGLPDYVARPTASTAVLLSEHRGRNPFHKSVGTRRRQSKCLLLPSARDARRVAERRTQPNPAQPSRLASGKRPRWQSRDCAQPKSGRSRIWKYHWDRESPAP